MKNDSDDLRSRFTRSLIKDTLIELLKGKPLKNVTVTELCSAANINRGTFYRHFYDIIDVYESIEEDVFRFVCEKLDKQRADALEYGFFRDMMLLVSENAVLASIVVANIGENSLIKRVVAYAKDKYVRDFQARFPDDVREETESLFTYIFNGSVGIIVESFKSGKEISIDKIAARIESYNKTLVSAFLSAAESSKRS